MTDEHTPAEVRLLRPDEFRSANVLFRASLHHTAASDEAWAERGPSYEEGRVFGALRDDSVVGTALSYGGEIVVPGGATLPMAMVTAVGVRADHTRRGTLTSLMRAQLTGMSEPIASLRASEAGIYGRFGYGVATRGRTVRIDRRRARLRPGAPGTSGSIRLLPLDDAWPILPALFDSLTERRPGWSSRPAGWWGSNRSWEAEHKKLNQVVIHSGPDGDDGFVLYHAERGGHRVVLEVADFCADGPEAWGALWRYLLSVDLVDDVRATLRPLDEPLEQMCVDRRAVETTSVEDETWLRLVDVPAALAARTFGDGDAVVIEVHDAFLPANSGRYRIGDGPAVPVAEPASLIMDVDTLAELYLGDVTPSALATAGRLTVDKSDALPMADRLFGIVGSPWCGTFF
jgi:predicted acetyltransferase